MSAPSTSSLQVELLSRDTDVKYWLLYLFLFALLDSSAYGPKYRVYSRATLSSLHVL